jgi:hypothetical protein
MRLVRVSLVISVALVVLFGLNVFVTLQPVQAAPAATIQSMIEAAPNGGTVNLAAGTYTESLTVNKSLTLTGVASNTTIIKAVTGQRVISVTAGNDLRLENLTVTGGQVLSDPESGGGGVLVADGNLTLVNCRVANNSASYGGGVLLTGVARRLDVSNSLIELNTARHGGGLYVMGVIGGELSAPGRVTITNTRIVSNTVEQTGGGIVVINSSLTLAGVQVVSNTADGGGGLFMIGGGSVLTNTQLVANWARNGGGLLVLDGDLSATNTQVLSNTANGDGGGLLVDRGNVDLWGGLVRGNRAVTGSGGGLMQASEAYAATLTDMRFEQNTARIFGGGASVSGTLIISHSTFTTNTVDTAPLTTTLAGGGGVYAVGPGQISASTFVSNAVRATLSFGGGVASEASLTIQDSAFDRNAANAGGGVFGSTITVTRSTFTGNAASFGGGGAFGVVLTITQSTFTRNTAPTGGGVVGGELVQAAESSFTANQASTGGGGLYGQMAILTNTRFISNTAGSGGGVLALVVDAVNTLFADNQAGGGAAIDTYFATLRHVTIAGATLRAMPAIQATSGLVAITDTIVSNYTVGISQTGGLLNADYNLFFTTTPTQTGSVTVTWGAHNLNADPKFVSPAAGNYRLALGSPAIDSGTNVGVMTDLADLSRPKGQGFDMGAYEFQPPVYLPLIRR